MERTRDVLLHELAYAISEYELNIRMGFKPSDMECRILRDDIISIMTDLKK